MSRTLSVVGAPSSAGAYAPGQERAPSAWRAHGLLDALRGAGRDVRDRGDVDGFRWSLDRDHPDAMNVDAAAGTARALADRVADALEADDDVLVLGGDCTVELGTIAGALRRGRSVALVYIDLDADLKVPATGEGALDWMGVAHLLDVAGAREELSSLGARRPMLSGSDVLLFAQDNITGSEAEIIAAAEIEVETLAAVRADPDAAVDRVLDWAAGHDEIWVHVDIDVLSWLDFPIAENSRRGDGLTLVELTAVLGRLVSAPSWRGLTVCEVNPDHASDEAESFERLVAAAAEIFSTERPQ
ncbi:arginase family protein [Nocardioides sp. CN2-186]|uniref:arginase family protein n=1 Tax=Nocardioides tweenelious TaxID=3156607 RepID=UPI0032B4A35F